MDSNQGTWYSEGIPAPSSYKKPDKVTLREGREQLAVMDEERKAKLSKKVEILIHPQTIPFLEILIHENLHTVVDRLLHTLGRL